MNPVAASSLQYLGSCWPVAWAPPCLRKTVENRALSSFGPAIPRPASGPLQDPRRVWLQPEALQAGRCTGQQDSLLQAYDDLGNPIAQWEIEARMRGAGGAGVLGGVIGAVVGGGLGLVAACSICPCDFWGTPCSPQEEAFSLVAFFTGLTWGAVGGALAAGDAHRIDRWEALEQIRAERRESSAGGGP